MQGYQCTHFCSVQLHGTSTDQFCKWKKQDKDDDDDAGEENCGISLTLTEEILTCSPGLL